MKYFKHHLNTGAILGLIFIGALIFRICIIYVFAWNTGLYYEYAEIARNIVDGYGYSWNWYKMIPTQPTAILTPLYTYFLALFIYLFDEPAKCIYVVQSLLNALVIIPGYFIGRLLGQTKNGIVLAFLVGIFPEIAFMPSRMAAETITIVLVFYSIYLYLKYKNLLLSEGKIAGFIVLGVVLGLTTLAKANTAFVFLACFVGLLFISTKKSIWLKAAFVLGLTFTITLSPWLIRNYLVFDKPVFRTMYGFNLWRGNHPGASGTGRLNSGQISEASLDPDYQKYIDDNHPGTELEIDKFYQDEAMKFIREDPNRYIWLTTKRMAYFLIIDPTHPLTRNALYIGGYLFVVIFGIWGGIILKRRKQFDRFYFLAPAIAMIFYIPVIILPRYRLILIWILLILASVALTNIITRIKFLDRIISVLSGSNNVSRNRLEQRVNKGNK